MGSVILRSHASLNGEGKTVFDFDTPMLML